MTPATAVTALLFAEESPVVDGSLVDTPVHALPFPVDLLAAPGLGLPELGSGDEAPVATGSIFVTTHHIGSSRLSHVVALFPPITESESQVRCSAGSVTFS